MKKEGVREDLGGFTTVVRMKTPRVSLGIGEMKYEHREWKGTEEQWRMEIMGNKHKPAIDSEREIDKDWTRHHPVPVPLATQHP